METIKENLDLSPIDGIEKYSILLPDYVKNDIYEYIQC